MVCARQAERVRQRTTRKVLQGREFGGFAICPEAEVGSNTRLQLEGYS